MLFALPEKKLVTHLCWLTSLGVILLPWVIMWGHLELTHTFNYLLLVTSAIVGSLLVTSRRETVSHLYWSDIAVCALAAITLITVTCLTIVYMGSTFEAIADSVILRAISFPSTFSHIAPISSLVLYTGTASMFLALVYRFMPKEIRTTAACDLALALLKVFYGSYAFYLVYLKAGSTLFSTVVVPFIWLVLVLPANSKALSSGQYLPRVLLCFLAALQTLQAYPVAGSQKTWAVLLVIPVAVICIHDALLAIWEVVNKRASTQISLKHLSRYRLVLILLLCGIIGFGYYDKMNLARLKSNYYAKAPLEYPGARHIRLPRSQQSWLGSLVDQTVSRCDGFIGLPGFASLYFWTGIAPPGIANNAWILNLEDKIQYQIIDKMESYNRPCAIFSVKQLKFWTRSNPLDSNKPLVNYIQSQYKPVVEFGGYQLMQKDVQQ